MAKKIETAEEALSLLRSGCKLTLSKGKFFVTGIEGEAPVYLKAAIRDKMKETNPVLFSAYAEINDALLKGHDEPEEQKEKLAGLTEGLPESAPEEKNVEPGTDITPNEFIMHDTERRLLETIITLENLHLVPEVKRYEIPFANLIEDANGNLIASDGGGIR
ncbi:MAG: hypothetical protein L6300_12725 [Syntrophaceae bacterium]|nr:hypothetical protein [Syntrophaceae bacterium]